MNNEQMIEKLRKELLLTRIFSMISSVLTICLLVGGYIGFSKLEEYEQQVVEYAEEMAVYAEQVQGYAEAITPAVKQFAKLDIKTINETLTQMNTVVGTVDWKMLNDSIASVDWDMLNNSIASVDWQEVSTQLEALDVEAINSAIEGLDTEELTKALETMNGVVDKLRSISDAFSNFAAKLGFGSKTN